MEEGIPHDRSQGGFGSHIANSSLLWHLPHYLLPQLHMPTVHSLKRGHRFRLVTVGGSG